MLLFFIALYKIYSEFLRHRTRTVGQADDADDAEHQNTRRTCRHFMSALR